MGEIQRHNFRMLDEALKSKTPLRLDSSGKLQVRRWYHELWDWGSSYTARMRQSMEAIGKDYLRHKITQELDYGTYIQKADEVGRALLLPARTPQEVFYEQYRDHYLSLLRQGGFKEEEAYKLAEQHVLYHKSQNQLLSPKEREASYRTLMRSDYYDSQKAVIQKEYADRGYEHTETLAEIVVTLQVARDQTIIPAARDALAPTAIKQGISGTYFVKDRRGATIGVFKPQYEEHGMPNNTKGSVREYDPQHPIEFTSGQKQGENYLREIAAYRMDHEGHFLRIPYTCEMSLLVGNTREPQLGSLQLFQRGVTMDACSGDVVAAIPQREHQLSAVRDILLGNGDRNTGNLLVDGRRCVPIDHGLIMPDLIGAQRLYEFQPNFAAWLPHLDERVALDPSVGNFVRDYPLEDKCRELREMGFSPSAIMHLRLRTQYLQEGLKRGVPLKRLCNMMCRMHGVTSRFNYRLQTAMDRRNLYPEINLEALFSVQIDQEFRLLNFLPLDER